ncbi:MAG TPA: RdgB/HAM1 family non-canonical purine NTP pyrophosphatase [bacterium]|nr:RdgB/HAM1 family non-canonical purine NTP pyrophosphatase [bacterium]
MAEGVPPKIVIATTNSGKFTEMVALLDGIDTEFVPLEGDVEPAPEEGETYEEVALGKARYYAEKTGLPVIADDSGLEILALGGWPGLNSARPMGDNVRLSDAQLIQAVLERMARYVHDAQRRARFVCAVAYADPKSGLQLVQRGSLYGVINKAPRGKHGFGYDPIFYVPDVWKTLAQMSPEEKNRFSHRRNAIVYLKPHLIHEFVKEAGYAV